jgi:hypothetical protein
MSVLLDANAFRKTRFGLGPVAKAYTPLVVETKTLYTIAGGPVAVCALWGVVTTDITVANTVKLQANPTVGTTQDLCAATDIGTTDTLAGAYLSFQGLTGDSLLRGVGVIPTLKQPLIIAAGTIEQVTATGADGGITWNVMWIPMADGATLVAA